MLLLLVASFSFAQNADVIQFEKSTQKFMRVDEGHIITLIYRFTYTGDTDLQIIPPTVDCSCTQVILPVGNIAPKSTNTIKIKFDTADKIGWQERSVILQFISNKKDSLSFEKKIVFKGAVKASKATKKAYKESQKKQ